MIKSPQYNQQQTESKQWKSEVEELHIHQNLETDYCQHLLKINSGFHVRGDFCEETIYM